MTRPTPEEAYPGLDFRPHSRGWLARFSGQPAECVHLEHDHTWVAGYCPDRVFLQGRAAQREGHRQPARPDVSLCRACLARVFEPELTTYSGRVAAFEPSAETVSQYFFVETGDFAAAGLRPEVAEAIEGRLEELSEGSSGPAICQSCAKPATWLWFSQREVASLDDLEALHPVAGKRFCSRHGAVVLTQSLESIQEVNLFYLNAPYGAAGAYVWI